MKQIFDKTSYDISKKITRAYSTSFSLGIRMLSRQIRPSIYAIYGFVRYADEIVDTFHNYHQAELLEDFVTNYKKALTRKISMNPVLNAFQEVVHKYELYDLVDDFIASMRLDLTKKEYQTFDEYERYIHGSANVVGLMCLKVFLEGDNERYKQLEPYAIKLGSAFQKVNFLRDIRNDIGDLGRSYFPNLTGTELSNEAKDEIVGDIEADFRKAFVGIRQLPVKARFGVYSAYRYYLFLLNLLKKSDSKELMHKRIRVSNPMKFFILFKAYLRHIFNRL